MPSANDVYITPADRKIDFYQSSAIAASISGSAADDLVLYTNGNSDQLVLDNGGNVGIGTNAPGETLHIVGTGRFTSSVAVGNTTQPTSTGLSVSTTIQVAERSSAPSHIDTWGVLWVKNDDPTNLYFTDDDGNDIALTNNGSPAGGGGDIGGTVSSGKLAIGTGTDTIGNFVDALTEDNSLYIGDNPSDTTSSALGNVSLGISALEDITSGDYNVAIGYLAGANLTTASRVTIVGQAAGQSQTTENNNTFLGERAGHNSNGGQDVTFVGALAGYNNDGSDNVMVGQGAGQSSNSQYQSVFVGTEAGYGNASSGYGNVAIGYRCFYSSTSGFYNVVIGEQAGYNITTGRSNIYIGVSGGHANTTNSYNTVVGVNALKEVDGAGSSNAFGYGAMQYSTADNATGIGQYALSGATGDYNAALGNGAGAIAKGSAGAVMLGYQAGTHPTGNYNVWVGYKAGYGVVDSGAAENVGIGREALLNITSAEKNVVIGNYAGYDWTTASESVAIGYGAAENNTTESRSVTIGYLASNTGVALGNVSIGYQAGKAFTSTSYENVVIGYNAAYQATARNLTVMGRAALSTMVTGNNQTAIGHETLSTLVSGASNTALGKGAGSQMPSGNNNVHIGEFTGRGNSSSSNIAAYNVYVGDYSGYKNEGDQNIGVGGFAQYENSTGYSNIAVGYTAMEKNTTGHSNTAIGHAALRTNVDGDNNVAVGKSALYTMEPSSDGYGKNTALGVNAGYAVTTGTGNVFIGYDAGNNTGHDAEDDKLVIANSNTTTPLIDGDFGGILTFNVTGNAPNSLTVTADQGAADGILIDSYEPRIVLKNRRSSGNDSVAIRYDNATPSLQIRTSRDSYTVPMAIFNDDGASFGINAGAWGAGVAIASGASYSLDNTTTNRIYRSSGVSFWDSTESYRLQGNTTSGYLQLDLNKITLVRNASSAASSMFQIGDGGTYDQFSILEDARGSTATNGYVKLRAKKTGNYGYAKISLGAISGSTTSELLIDSISTNEALRFDTNSKSHAFDIAKAGYVSVGGAVDSTNQFTVIGTTVLSGATTITGSVRPGTDNGYDLGTAALRWSKAYLDDGFIEINADGATTDHAGAGRFWVSGTTPYFNNSNILLGGGGDVVTAADGRWTDGNSTLAPLLMSDYGAVSNAASNAGTVAYLYWNNTTSTLHARNLNVGSSATLPADTTATTQSAGDNSTKVATTAYADAAGGGSSVSFGSDNQIPYTNAGGDDFDYSANLTFDGTDLFLDTSGGGKLKLGAATEYIQGSGSDVRIYASDNVLISPTDDLNIRADDVTIETTSASEYVRFDGGNQRVGIGTTSPSMKLQVVDTDHEVAEFESSHSAGASIKIDATSTGGTHWKFQSTADGSSHGGGKLSIQKAGANKVVIDGDGLVGINTTSPTDLLTIQGDTNASTQVGAYAYSATNDKTAKIFLNKSANSTAGSHTAVADDDVLGLLAFRGSDGDSYEIGAQIRGQATQDFAAGARGTDLIFSTVDNSTTTLDDRMVIAQDGKVGINTAAPQQQLHVEGGFRFRDGNSSSQRLEGYGWNDNFALVVSGSDALGLCGGTPGVRFLDGSANTHLQVTESSHLANVAVVSGGAGIVYEKVTGHDFQATTAANLTLTTGQTAWDVVAEAVEGNTEVTLTLPDPGTLGDTVQMHYYITCKASAMDHPLGGAANTASITMNVTGGGMINGSTSKMTCVTKTSPGTGAPDPVDAYQMIECWSNGAGIWFVSKPTMLS